MGTTLPPETKHERKLGAREEVLHHHTARAELVVQQHIAQRRVGLLVRRGDHHALAGGKAVVGTEHGRKRTRTHAYSAASA